MRIDLLEPGDPRWTEALRKLPYDVYSLPGYVGVEAERSGAAPLCLYGEDDRGSVLLPLLLRDIPDNLASGATRGWRDATSPYGYPGVSVLAAEGEEMSLLADFLGRALPTLSELRVISVFLRLNPVLNNASWFGGRGTLVAHGETVWIDLLLAQEELSRQTRDRFRGNISAARRDGLQVEPDESWSHVGTFTDLYHLTMRHVGAESWYLFPESYFKKLRSATGGAVHLFVVRSQDGIPAAGLFSECNGIVQYLFSGKDESGAHPHATKLMMVEVRDWAKARGNRVMHLGGGLGARADSLGQFKRGFSKLTAPFHTWRWILDGGRYRDLVERWRIATGEPADHQSGFFPAYRKAGHCTPQDKGESQQKGSSASDQTG